MSYEYTSDNERIIAESILNHEYNRDKVYTFISIGLNPTHGLSSILTMIMFDLYSMSSGDGQYNGRYSCSSCCDVVFRKLQDFLVYDDNMGKPLINWKKEI